MKTRMIKLKEIETIFGKKNYIVLLIGMILIIVGYVLMGGEGSSLSAYNPDIFSKLRIGIAPLVCLAGYLAMVFGIMYRFPVGENPKEHNEHQ